MTTDTNTNALYRPASGRILGGVCAGLAQRFGWSPTTVRILFLLSCLLPGPQFIAYIAMWIIIPGEASPRARVSG